MHYNSISKLVAITIVLLLSVTNSAQSQDVIDYFHKKNNHLLSEKIDRLNELGKGLYTFEINDQTNLTVNFFEDGKMYRKDEIYLETLNPEKISFSEKEEAIICKCKSADQLNKRLKRFREGCVQRHILKNDIMRPYFRINFKITEEKEEFMKIMKELIISAWTYQ